MAANQTEPPFYQEVDRYRYRTNWGCLGWMLAVVVVTILVVWWILKKLWPGTI